MVAARGIRRELRPLDHQAAMALPGQLGVYEIVDADGLTVEIGQAGAGEPFGLRSALAGAAGRHPGTRFRYETTHAYRSRWQELLMLHRHVNGRLPPANSGDARLLGRLS